MMRALLVACALVGAAGNPYPSVLGHGMGDSCFNAGMKEITEFVGTTLGTHATCVPTGDTQSSDTNNGFFMSMDKNVDAFAAGIRNDTKLKDGFNCIGFSQGNSLCRGYVHKYNDPPVKNIMSVHGTVSGVAAIPNCDPSGLMGPICRFVAEITGDAAYSSLVQNHLFQAGYFRDPKRVTSDSYKKNSEIAQWNNEGDTVNAQYKKNFISVDKFVMIKAEKDSMVYPNEGEWWGHFADGSLTEILTMKQTKWYTEDLFGLKTVDERGGIFFNSTKGNHLDFTKEQLKSWLEFYGFTGN